MTIDFWLKLVQNINMDISTKDLLDFVTQKSPFAGGAFGKLYKIESGSEFAKIFNQTSDSVFKFHAYNFYNAKTLSEIKNRIEYLKSRVNSTLVDIAKIKRLMQLDLKYSTLPSDIVYVEGLPVGIMEKYINGTNLIDLGFKDMPDAEKKLIIDSLVNGQIELLENYISKNDMNNLANAKRLLDEESEIPIQIFDFDDMATSFIDDSTDENYSDKCETALDKIESVIQTYIEPDYEMPNEVYKNFKIKN